MPKTREILRQKWELGRTHRATALSLGTSAGAVGAVIARASAAELEAITPKRGVSIIAGSRGRRFLAG